MNKNLSVIASELFDKIRTQFPNLKLGDENSEVTSEPEDARFFEFDYKHKGQVLGRISVSLSEDDGLVVIYSNDVVGNKDDYVKKQFFGFLKELREFAKQHLLTFDTRDISKSNLEKRDYEHLSKTNFGESNMSESKLFGTSMTSYQNLGNAKLIVKHSAPVNLENPAGRAQRIESIYVENVEGERFKYPYRHLGGARALAQHIGHGGNPYDSIGKHVIGLSEELNKLRMFKHYVERNQAISEAMGGVTSKVMERIDSVKKEIYSLQNPTHYKEFAESFEEATAKEIPEEIMNDWIDRLTIRTFNEELKNVFPYIFKLVDEGDIPVKELGIDDLVEVSEEMEESTAKEIPEVEAYESFLNSIVESNDLFGDDNQDLVAQLNELITEPLLVGVDGTNATESLKGIIDDEELFEVFKELGEVSPDSDVRDILKDYITIKDQEQGTDVLSQLTFPEGNEPPAEVPAEPAPAEVPAEPAPAEEVPLATQPAPAAPAAAPAPVMADIWSESKEDPPFDPDEKPSKDVTPGKSGQGHSKAKHLAKKGMQAAIAKAKKAGATAETIIRIAGKEMTLGEAVVKAGMTVEDVFGNKSDELVEFIKSMYNTEEGSFPKGETGVLIACEKKFGDRSVSMAKKVIERLHQVNEMSRMKKLAGLKEGPGGENDPGFVRRVQDQHSAMVEKNPRYANEHAGLKIAMARGMIGNSAETNKQWAIKTAQLLKKHGVTVESNGLPSVDDIAKMPGAKTTNSVKWDMDDNGKKTSGTDQAGHDAVMGKFKDMSKGIGGNLGLGDVDITDPDAMHKAIQGKIQGMAPKMPGMPSAGGDEPDTATPAPAGAAPTGLTLAKKDPKAVLQKMPDQQITNMSGDQAKKMLADLKKMAGLTK